MTVEPQKVADIGGVPSELPPLVGARPPTLGERAVFDAYGEAIKGALSAASGAAEKVLTAVFTLATAYVALVGILRPDKTAAPIIVALPFVFLAFGGVAAMVGLLWGVGPSDPQTVSAVKAELSSALKAKRIATGLAVVLVVIAIGLGTVVVTQTYGIATPTLAPSASPLPTAS